MNSAFKSKLPRILFSESYSISIFAAPIETNAQRSPKLNVALESFSQSKKQFVTISRAELQVTRDVDSGDTVVI